MSDSAKDAAKIAKQRNEIGRLTRKVEAEMDEKRTYRRIMRNALQNAAGWRAEAEEILNGGAK